MGFVALPPSPNPHNSPACAVIQHPRDGPEFVVIGHDKDTAGFVDIYNMESGTWRVSQEKFYHDGGITPWADSFIAIGNDTHLYFYDVERDHFEQWPETTDPARVASELVLRIDDELLNCEYK